MDGGGITQLFHLEDAALNLTNITLINGHGESGGAIHAQDGSQVHVDGMIIFANNYAASGGAIRIESGSTLSLNGHTTFANNMADGKSPTVGPGGGALSCFESNISSSGITVFVNNSASRDGGAVRIGLRSTANWHGNTSFLDNRSRSKGGGLMASQVSRIEFHGTTVAMGNFAGNDGGAFRMGSDSGIITTSVVFNGSTTIHNNSAGNLGGAISVHEKCDVSWDGNMTLSENTAANNGGAVSVVGDATLTSRGPTLFRGNSADLSGGGVYSSGNINGQSYDGVVFYSNMAARGGAVATFSTLQQSQNTYTSCIFRNNIASPTGGAVEASVGKDKFIDSSFFDNSAGGFLGLQCPPGGGMCTQFQAQNTQHNMSNFPSLGHALFAAVAGGALRLSGLVEMWNVSFERNSASREGAAISNIGHINNMSVVLFNDNYFSCNIGEFLEYLDVEVSIRVLMDISIFP